MIQVGDVVRLAVLPPWVDELPPESRSVFERCVGRGFRVAEIDEQGLLVLDVSTEVDRAFDGSFHDIRVEAEYVQPV